MCFAIFGHARDVDCGYESEQEGEGEGEIESESDDEDESEGIEEKGKDEETHRASFF